MTTTKTRQEAIREGVAKLLYGQSDKNRGSIIWADVQGKRRQHYLMHADDILGYEADKGCVLKVDPPLEKGDYVPSSGVTAWEPLIQE